MSYSSTTHGVPTPKIAPKLKPVSHHMQWPHRAKVRDLRRKSEVWGGRVRSDRIRESEKQKVKGKNDFLEK